MLLRRGRACPGHPRLTSLSAKTWMPGIRLRQSFAGCVCAKLGRRPWPGMTRFNTAPLAKRRMRLPRKFARNINVICPVQPLRKKHFAFAVGQISSTSSPRPFPARGALRGRHERGMGCGGRGSVGAQVCSQGGFRERAAARRRTALQRLSQNSTGSTWFVESFGRGRCVRRSRVVLASVADAKPCGD